jgi:hypothetical protein
MILHAKTGEDSVPMPALPMTDAAWHQYKRECERAAIAETDSEAEEGYIDL